MNSDELKTALYEWADKVVNTKLNMEADILWKFAVSIDYWQMIQDVTGIIEQGFDVELRQEAE